MKKIFTLIFSLGLLTAAFAQDGRHEQEYKHNPPSKNSSFFERDSHQKNGNDQGYGIRTYSDSRGWSNESRDRRNDNTYDEHTYGRDGFADRKDSKRPNDFGRPHSKMKLNKRSGISLFFSFGGR